LTVSGLCVHWCADSPDAEVQNFRNVTQHARSVKLEWLSPRRTDITRYRVSAA